MAGYKTWHEIAVVKLRKKVMRSNSANDFLFIFKVENILRSNLTFSTSHGRSTI